jgi:hypothetical protein
VADGEAASAAGEPSFVKAAVIAVSLLLAWLASYVSGVWPWLGKASMTRSSVSAGNITIAGESRRGMDVGFDDFLFFEGQEVVIEYDAEVRRGSLWFHVFRMWDGQLGDGTGHYVSESGKGTWTARIPKTGLYHITIEGSPTRGKCCGWDLSYDAAWGARWP